MRLIVAIITKPITIRLLTPEIRAKICAKPNEKSNTMISPIQRLRITFIG
jgi:hypothetical protein